MFTFKEYLEESVDYVKKAEDALLAGDYATAREHLKKHVAGVSRKRDAYVAKLNLKLKQKLKQ